MAEGIIDTGPPPGLNHVRVNLYTQVGSTRSMAYLRAVDPHSFFADPEPGPALFLNADPAA